MREVAMNCFKFKSCEFNVEDKDRCGRVNVCKEAELEAFSEKDQFETQEQFGPTLRET